MGFHAAPDATLDGLTSLYRQWCQRVPFDNVRKLIHVGEGAPGPLPGDDPIEFFEAWLKWGTGGTCWAGSGALFTLLRSLGFETTHGIGTMLVLPDLPPNHGTVVVYLDGTRYLVDTSMLHGEPLLLHEEQPTAIDHPAWGVRCRRESGHWHVNWRALHVLGGFDCRINTLDAPDERHAAQHEQTRGWSPFNFELSARLNHPDRVVGAGFGKRVEIAGDGSATSTPLDAESRRRLLVDDLRMSEEIVDRLPPDRATPPPPGSMTARQADTKP